MSLERSLDRLVGLFSPQTEVRRIRARATADLLRLHYEGASFSRRTAGWIAHQGSENSASFGRLGVLRARSRDLVRNYAWAASAVADFESDAVGTGIVPRPVHKDPKVRARALELWREHCETTDIDSEGRLDVYGLQGLAARTVFESGDVLVRRRRRRLSDGYRVPFQLELLEPDHLDETHDVVETRSGGRVFGGVELDALEQRVGYWLLPVHPGEVSLRSLQSRFVPASEVLHVFQAKRPKQLRGVPALHAVLVRLKDLDDYEDASLLKQKISACLAAFVTDSGEGDLPAPAEGGKQLQDLEPGAQVRLRAGESVLFSDPPASDNYQDYVTNHLRAVAAAVGTTYESLSRDWSKVNYSSARVGARQVERAIERFRWLTLRPQLLDPMWRWFVEAAQLAGELPLEPIGVRWTPPRRSLLDPSTEVPGLRDQARAGLTSISELLRENGLEPEEVWTELASDQRRLAELGLKVECDPSVPLRGGPPAPTGDPTADAPAKPAKGKPGT